ncbi:MAG: hypothetical protein ACAF41_15370 [Leptolyngbya sp. BL-A-14]
MRAGLFIGWSLLVFLGLNLLDTRSATALEEVHYTPGSPFVFDPVAGNPNQNFGTVDVQSDNANGWNLQVRSLNHSALKSATSNDTINYTLTVDGASVDLAAGNDATAKTTATLTCNQPGVCHYPVLGTIGAGAIDGKPAGAYTDTLIFTITSQ